MKFYSVALVRALLPLLRHRLARVRIAGIDAIRDVVKVPNRDKRKGAGKGDEEEDGCGLLACCRSVDTGTRMRNSSCPLP
jgi:hypothetical protein